MHSIAVLETFFCFCPCFWKHETITEGFITLLQDELYYAQKCRIINIFSLGKKNIVDMIRNSFKLADAENCDSENMLYRQPNANTYV